jgi:hypothetical protein
LVMLSFRIFRAAMFAEPTITEVIEVVGLIHGRWGRPPLGKQLLTWLPVAQMNNETTLSLEEARRGTGPTPVPPSY